MLQFDLVGMPNFGESLLNCCSHSLDTSDMPEPGSFGSRGVGTLEFFLDITQIHDERPPDLCGHAFL